MSFRGERAMGDKLFESMAAGTVTPSSVTGMPGSKSFWSRWTEQKLQAMVPHVHAVYLRRMTKCVEIAKLPFAEQTQQLATLEKQPMNWDVANIFTNLLMGAYSKIPGAFQREQAHLRCAAVALATERYRRTRDRWPESPEEAREDWPAP